MGPVCLAVLKTVGESPSYSLVQSLEPAEIAPGSSSWGENRGCGWLTEKGQQMKGKSRLSYPGENTRHKRQRTEVFPPAYAQHCKAFGVDYIPPCWTVGVEMFSNRTKKQIK